MLEREEFVSGVAIYVSFTAFFY